MEDYSDGFPTREVESIMREEISRVLDGVEYRSTMSKSLTNDIASAVIQRVKDIGGGLYKFASHCLFMRNSLAGFDTYSSSMWHPPEDGVAVYDYTNQSIRFIMTVWGIKIENS